MKTNIFETKEQYIAFRNAWKETCKDKNFQFAAEHFALYAIIRGKDPKKCFASPEKQSTKKLRCQGKHGNESYNTAMRRINGGFLDGHLLAPFQGTFTVLDLLKLREGEKKEAA